MHCHLIVSRKVHIPVVIRSPIPSISVHSIVNIIYLAANLILFSQTLTLQSKSYVFMNYPIKTGFSNQFTLEDTVPV